MTSNLIHFLIEESFEVWRFAVTSFDIITGMAYVFYTGSVFLAVSWLCMSKRDTGIVCNGVSWLCMSKRDTGSASLGVSWLYVSKKRCVYIHRPYLSFGHWQICHRSTESFYLTYMGSPDSWEDKHCGCSPIIYRISCN